MCSTVKVKYSGTKSYDKKFKDEGVKKAEKSTKYTVTKLVPGSEYIFELYGTSKCGESASRYVNVETKVEGEHLILSRPGAGSAFADFERLQLFQDSTKRCQFL